MTQPQFNKPTFKTRTSILLFAKGLAAPLVLYFENPQQTYSEIQEVLKSSMAPKLLEFEALGPVKKVSLLSSQISGVAIQEEPQLQ